MSTPSAQDHAQKRLFLDAYALTASTIASGLAGLVSVLLSTYLFDASIVGTAAGMTAAMLLIAGIAQLDLTNVMHRYLPTAGASASRLIIRIYIVVVLLSLVLAWGFVTFFGGDIFGDDRAFAAIWFAIAVALWGLFNLQDQVLVGLGAAWLVPIENTIHGLARIGLLIAFVGGGAAAIFATWIIPAAVLLVVMSFVLVKKALPNHRARVGEKETVASLREISRFAAGGYIGAISGLVLANLLPVLVLAHLGSDSNAHFYIAWVVTSMVDLVALNFGASLVVQGAAHQEHVPHLLRSALRKQVILIVPCLIVLAALAGPLLSVPGDGSYREASTMLTLLALGLIPRLIWGVYLPAVRLSGDVKAMIVSQGLTNLLVIIGTVVGLYTYGLTGIGVGYVIAQIVIAIAVAPRLLPLMRDRQEVAA